MEQKLSAFRHLFIGVSEIQDGKGVLEQVADDGNTLLRQDEIEQIGNLLATMVKEADEIAVLVERLSGRKG